MTVEREELSALRREVKQLRMEREILQKATVFFAKEQMQSSPSSTRRRTIIRSSDFAEYWAFPSLDITLG
ncbi:MAG: hypothetical protein EOP10_32475 [Proteobacteria bacterium]|nr:MAG: hypothetical protein EOP10_32475 [Pseudomonadota bacterium]